MFLARNILYYIALFALALYLLWRRRPKGCRLFACFILVMFLLSTAEIVPRAVISKLSLRALYSVTRGDISPKLFQGKGNLLRFVENVLGVTENAISEGIQIYRCYTVWKTSYNGVVAPPIFLPLPQLVRRISLHISRHLYAALS
ncbi:hypothetical protein B0H19DRAFT_1185626 [Mycena capillaripes]|nr:hypothetical protein B0H19DRAFT_1185626 [Mycena capillaripes]